MSDVVKYGLMWIFNRLIPQKMFKAQREQQRATRDKKIRWLEDLYSLERKPVVANKQTFRTASKNLLSAQSWFGWARRPQTKCVNVFIARLPAFFTASLAAQKTVDSSRVSENDKGKAKLIWTLTTKARKMLPPAPADTLYQDLLVKLLCAHAWPVRILASGKDDPRGYWKATMWRTFTDLMLFSVGTAKVLQYCCKSLICIPLSLTQVGLVRELHFDSLGKFGQWCSFVFCRWRKLFYGVFRRISRHQRRLGGHQSRAKAQFIENQANPQPFGRRGLWPGWQ